MWDQISQFAIFIFGALGILLIAKKNKWGFVFGLLTQPFWYITSFIHRQWGVFFVSIGYTLSWLYGVYQWFSDKEKKIQQKPKVGLGVIIVNQEGKILIGKRKGLHAPYYSIPGGKLDAGETFAQGAIREVKEETNLDIKDMQVIGITNNLETYKKEGVHFISVILLAKEFSGELKVMEPEKCEGWIWVEPTQLPQPHFEASQKAIKGYLENKFYN